VSQVLDNYTQVVALGAACCLPQVLDRCSHATARGAARYALQLLDRGAQVVARGAGAVAAGEEQLGRCAAEHNIYYRLYRCSGK
jgi:glutamate 5-kinase